MSVNASNQPSRFRTKNCQIKFKTALIKSSLLVSGALTITGRGADPVARQVDERNKE